MKEYALKFHYLSRYATMIVFIMRARMRRFALGLSNDLVLEFKAALLNNYIVYLG